MPGFRGRGVRRGPAGGPVALAGRHARTAEPQARKLRGRGVYPQEPATMNAITRKVSPDAISQIRMDHTHTMATFHQYRLDEKPRVRRALVDHICLALEVHAQLEEEIFYPAMREALEDRNLVDEKLLPEQDEMRELIATLRSTDAEDPEFDATFMQLMRVVIHHVADEETVLLPDAERVLGREMLQDLGAEMTKRRMALMAPRAGEVASSVARAAPAATAMIVAGTLIAGTYVARRAFSSRY